MFLPNAAELFFIVANIAGIFCLFFAYRYRVLCCWNCIFPTRALLEAAVFLFFVFLFCCCCWRCIFANRVLLNPEVFFVVGGVSLQTVFCSTLRCFFVVVGGVSLQTVFCPTLRRFLLLDVYLCKPCFAQR